ncbi:MAG: ParB N-terminal domain-containing protein [Bryobacterales bacterium]|jgi:hypothetical protein|nr:ParB N-terminal domain-containing protein [Bryobacterales bacterium]
MAQVRAQEFEMVSVAELTPHPANPRKGDVGAIARSVQANGFYGAVVAQRRTGYILAGNHRWRAAQQEGLRLVPVLWLDCSDEEARRILLADNKTNDLAGYDQEALARVLEAARVADAELTGTGWTPGGYEALIAQLGDAVLGGGGAAGATGAENGPEIAGGDSPRGDGRCPFCGGPGRGTASEVADRGRADVADSEPGTARP